MKTLLKNTVAAILGNQIKRLRAKHEFKLIAIAGSTGKTSSKLAIASVLAQSFNVRYQSGNYNDPVTVPLIFFGQAAPNIFNPIAWLYIFAKNEIKIRKRFPYEVVVIELGSDGPGQLIKFSPYIKADIGVLTAITPEHMQFFGSMDVVAAEELTLGELSKQLLINKDLIEKRYLDMASDNILTYGISEPADFRLTGIKFTGDEARFDLVHKGQQILSSGHQRISEPQLYSVLAAATVANLLKMPAAKIDKGIRSIPPVSGRMQHLQGINGSVIIDDTYNASPEATKAALNTLYRIEAAHKIAVLGNMNELGHFSKPEHEAIGAHCDCKQLDLVVTLGPDANRFLAPVAKKQGCQVKSFDDPYSVGEYIKPLLKKGAVVLVKGSQNKVFAEETVKILLKDPADAAKLVRQSDYWMKIKRKAFAKPN